jgi:tRNA-dihydrouridine synthase A
MAGAEAESPALTSAVSPWRLCVAPMLDVTDRHYRVFLRALSRRARLYSEMVTTGALLHGDARRWLAHDPAEHPLALQVGGSEPRELAACARLAADAGYDEINLNCGCPSDRVQAGRFGACLMREPHTVAEGVAAMRAASTLPVTVKSRIGVDEQEDYPALARFVSTVAEAGCGVFIIHARKAWLKGLSPKENREVPPLRYELARQVKRDFPALTVVLNGGIRSLEAARGHLGDFDGVMLGRAISDAPWQLADMDAALFGEPGPATSRAQALRSLLPYVTRTVADGTALRHVLRGWQALTAGEPGARAFRQHIHQLCHTPGAGVAELGRLLDSVRE